jgi:hypothetical protein
MSRYRRPKIEGGTTRTARQTSSSFELICLLPAAIPAAPRYNRVIFRTSCVSSPTDT